MSSERATRAHVGVRPGPGMVTVGHARPGRGDAGDPNDPLRPWLQLAALDWLGPTLARGLIERFGDPVRAFAAGADELADLPGWTDQRLRRFLALKNEGLPPVDPAVSRSLPGVRVVTLADPEYPPRLREIPDAPVVLWVLGDLRAAHQPAIAIVGSRQASQQGLDIARQFGHGLSNLGFTVVSGLALGIDSYAHVGALEGRSPTVAVLGCGIDVVHPRSNHRVRQQIIGQGALITEFPPGSPPLAHHFPVRNRVISGLCLGVVVIEGGERSGSMITARHAIQQDREVFAVPGNIRHALATGPNALLKAGATPVTGAEDVAAAFEGVLAASGSRAVPGQAAATPRAWAPPPRAFSDRELEVLALCADEPVSLDRLVATGRFPTDELYSLLLRLEIDAALTRFPGNRFQTRVRLDAPAAARDRATPGRDRRLAETVRGRTRTLAGAMRIVPDATPSPWSPPKESR